jgi:hypothetical protein
MAYNQKQNAGRGNMPKTGRDIPLNMKSPLYMANGPGDESDKKPGDNKSKEQKARELAKKRAEEARVKAGKNEGDSKNVRTFKGEASYVVSGKKVERYAKTPEEIAAWKKASEESKAKYRDKTKKVIETVSDTGVDKQKPTTPPENKKDDRVYFFKGSNAHNMNFGGHTTYGRTKGKPDPSNHTSYTVSPSKPISGRPNTFESRPATDREMKAMKSRFFSKTASPYHNAMYEAGNEAGWNNYLTQVEGRESKLQSKVSERNKLKQNTKLERQNKKEALELKKAERAAKIKAFNKSRGYK